ncbi:MAG: hypothetical protein QOG67_1143 [Verrucomicrobiota bacterium]|jgi:hypothetical protein
MRTIATLLLLSSALTFGQGASGEPFLSYRWHGGLSPYNEIAIGIESNGHAHVRSERLRSKPHEYDTELTKEELEALRTMVRSTDFFSQPEKDSEFATDVGETELTISQDSRTRKLTFGYRPALDPLCWFLRKLHTQAEAFRSLAEKDIYEVLTALAPNYASPKVLQPQRLKQPLMTYLIAETSNQKIQWALEALATLTTPEEFAGFIARQNFLEHGVLPDYGNFPETHRLALCPLYLAFLKEKYPHLSQFEKQADWRAEGMVRALGDLRYRPAIPFFMKWFDGNKNPGAGFGLAPLAQMESAGIPPLAAQLDNPSETLQQSAIELLTIASKDSPQRGLPNVVSKWEYSEMTKLFTRTVLPKLEQLAANDSSATTRKKAAAAIEEIKKEIDKAAQGEAPTKN